MKKCLFVFASYWLMSCSATLPTYETHFSGNAIEVPVDNFANSIFNIIADNSNPYDILLTKDSPGAYSAFYLQCTFDKKALDVTPSELVCPVCASVFNFDGTVKKGPAETELTHFNTELNRDQTLVRIDISALGR